MRTGLTRTKPFNTQRSIRKASKSVMASSQLVINSYGKRFSMSNRMERAAVIRNCIPYEAIELISERLNLPMKSRFLKLTLQTIR